MGSLKGLGIFMCRLALGATALAGTNSVVRNMSRETLVAPMRAGTVVLQVGGYVVRHTMQGESHGIAFQRAKAGNMVFKYYRTSDLGTFDLGTLNPRRIPDPKR
jgi:hypothetical protein